MWPVSWLVLRNIFCHSTQVSPEEDNTIFLCKLAQLCCRVVFLFFFFLMYKTMSLVLSPTATKESSHSLHPTFPELSFTGLLIVTM